MLHIFTDGACQSNGKAQAKAGFSVVFWNLPGSSGLTGKQDQPQEPVGLAERVPECEPQTNQRAELRGMAKAFEEIQRRQLKSVITIWTDSDYVKKCVTEWGPQWKARGWRRAANAKKPLEHLDLLKPMIEFYEANQHFIRIQHVAAHTGKKEFPWTGNEMADRFATQVLQKQEDLVQ